MKHRLGALALLLLFLAACSGNPNGGTAPPQHTFTVRNNTSAAHKQLTRIKVTPVNGGATLTATFVCNYGETKSVPVAIPRTGNYTVRTYSSDGQSMWWDSVALALPGSSTLDVFAAGYPVRFSGTCAGIPNDGTTMTP